MEAAHRAGIVHRDLKPENLFVTQRDGGPFIKIMDFGVSKFATASAGELRSTRAGVTYGSPAYMSPEQLTGQLDIDGRADVFALGVVLFECLTGERPFDADTIPALVVKILAGTVPPIESLRPGLPPALVEVVHRALAPDRDDRIPSAQALTDALGPFRATRLPAGPLGFAATMASGPAFAGPHVPAPSTLPPLPPGAKAGRRGLVLAGLAAMFATASLGVLAARSRPPRIAVPEPPPSVPAPVPPVPEPVTVLAPASVSPSVDVTQPAPSKPRPHRPAASAAPSSSSAAQSLGLRTDNPFR
jgi:serine/threonine-protein kinase